MMTSIASLLLASALPARWEFIWACYGVTLVVFVVLVLVPIIKRGKLDQQLKDYYRRKDLLSNADKSHQSES